MSTPILQIQVSLKGRHLKTYSFNGDEVRIGRDPDTDVVLDNPGVSRGHARLLRCDTGYVVEDLGSANGTYLNDHPVQRKEIRDGDVIRVGKFSLWVGFRQDMRRRSAVGSRAATPDAYEGTTVLKNDQLARMLESVQQSEASPPELDNVVPLHAFAPDGAELPVKTSSASTLVLIGSLSFIVGTLMGMLATWMVLR